MSPATLVRPRRVDGWEKVTGAAAYSSDVELPHTAFGTIVRAERAHARIIGIDVDAGRPVEGVIAVMCGTDLKGIEPRFGHIIPDHPVLAIDKVRYYGEPVALVVAESRGGGVRRRSAGGHRVRRSHTADERSGGRRLRRPASTTWSTATKPTAASSVCARSRPATSSTRTASSGAMSTRRWPAPSIVVETATTYPMVFGYAMELYNASASFRPGHLHVVTTAQHPLQVRAELARMFALPLAAVRVEVPLRRRRVRHEVVHQARAARRGRLVVHRPPGQGRRRRRRGDAHDASRRRRGTGADRVRRRRPHRRPRLRPTLDSGAYADNSPLVLTKSVHRCFGPYRIPNLRVRGRAIYTNTTPASSYRGFGAPQGDPRRRAQHRPGRGPARSRPGGAAAAQPPAPGRGGDARQAPARCRPRSPTSTSSPRHSRSTRPERGRTAPRPGPGGQRLRRRRRTRCRPPSSASTPTGRRR